MNRTEGQSNAKLAGGLRKRNTLRSSNCIDWFKCRCTKGSKLPDVKRG